MQCISSAKAVTVLSSCADAMSPPCKLSLTSRCIAFSNTFGASSGPNQLNVPVNFVGPYYRGDGLGSNYDLVLKADGTYTVESYACMGKSGDASGTWHVPGKTLTLSPVKATGNINFAKTLDVVECDGRTVFVEPDMRADFKKYGVRYSYWCFKRTDYPANTSMERCRTGGPCNNALLHLCHMRNPIC